MHMLSGVGMGLVGIFIPIYLLELTYSFSAVVSWLLMHHLSLLCGAFLVIYISNAIGLVRCWYIRVVLVALLFSGLSLLPSYPALLYALAFISGMEAAFFWIPFNILTVRKTEASTMGSSLAFMSNMGSAVGIAIPGIAALIIVHYGYLLLFIIAFLFILVSIIPVLPLKGETTHFQFSTPVVSQIIRVNRKFILPEILDNLGQDAQVIWTLFIFITALTVLDIGILGVLIGIIGMVITHSTGTLIDRWNRKTVMRFGAVGTTILWVISYVIAVYSPTPIMLYITTALRGFVLGIFAAAYGTTMFNRARSADAQFLVLREVPTIFGRVVLFGITLALLSVGQLELVFLVVAVLSLYFWFNDFDSLIKLSRAEF